MDTVLELLFGLLLLGSGATAGAAMFAPPLFARVRVAVAGPSIPAPPILFCSAHAPAPIYSSEVWKRMQRANDVARNHGSTQPDGSFGPSVTAVTRDGERQLAFEFAVANEKRTLYVGSPPTQHTDVPRVLAYQDEGAGRRR